MHQRGAPTAVVIRDHSRPCTFVQNPLLTNTIQDDAGDKEPTSSMDQSIQLPREIQLIWQAAGLKGKSSGA